MHIPLRRSRPRPRSVALLVGAVLVVWMVGDEINVVLGSGLHRSPVFGAVAYEAVLQLAGLLCVARGVLYKRERAAWIAIGLGCMAWGAGDIYYQAVLGNLKSIPIPSPADGGYLSFYPFVFVGVILLFRARSGRTSTAQWLDGLTAALAAGALSAAVALDAVLGTVGGQPLVDLTDLAYPVGDLLVLGVVIGALVVCGRRAGRVWLWVGLGISIFCVGDALYLVQSARGTYQVGSWFDIGWPAGMVCLAAAAWSDVSDRVASTRRDLGGVGNIGVPMGFALLSIGLLLYTGSKHLNWAARLLAAASLGVVLLRLAATFRDYARVSAQRELEATTDALTGLANRRALNADLAILEDQISPGRAATVAIFDLDGFKQYNDTFGHQAGDALLARLSAKLRESVGGDGRAYRMGGDEFCVVLHSGIGGGDETVQRAVAALVELGDGFVVRCSFGAVHMPSEASDAEEALRIADQRMYDYKGGARTSAKRQSRDVLLQVLREHTPERGDHTQGVRELAEAVARRLGLDDAEVELVGNTAALHDIGKMAIPRSIIDKPGPLDADEWTFMRRHTLIGERIVSAAPALAEISSAIRATHERWDATGYPDRLPGPSIPTAARVVAVCGAFDAMISDRPYAVARSVSDAVAELKRCAGSQFDPAVVEAFDQVLADRSQQLGTTAGPSVLEVR